MAVGRSVAVYAGPLSGRRRSEGGAVTESTQQPRESWSEVGRQFEELGRALRGHFGREPEPGPAPAAEGAATDASGRAGDQAARGNALRRLGQAAQHLGGQAGGAVRDPAVRESAQRAARTFV